MHRFCTMKKVVFLRQAYKYFRLKAKFTGIVSHALLLLTVLLPVTGQMAFAAGKGSDRNLSPDVPSVTVNILSEKPFTIGDSIDFALTIYHKRKDRVFYPKDTKSLAPFEVRGINEKRRKIKSGMYKTDVVYTLTAYQTGNLTFPSLEVTIGLTKLKTEPVSIPILSVLPRNNDNPPLKDIVPPLRARIRPVTIILILVSICAALILFMVTSKYLVKKLNKKKVLAPSIQQFDSYLYSIKQLTEIKDTFQKNLADEKNIYSRLSYVLRLFFGHILDVPALEMTTGELKRLLHQKGRYVRPVRLLNILTRSDLVKFAKDRPARRTIGSDIDTSITIIKQTHRKVEEAQASSEAKEGVSHDAV